MNAVSQLISSMNWLSGQAVCTRSLQWPSDDAALDSWGWSREGSSVMNGMILCWFSFTTNHSTIIYVADTRHNQETTPVVLNRVAVLDYAAHGVTLVGEGFASVEWIGT